MSRRCSHCGHNGHNSRTCLEMRGGFKLFGVRVSSESMSSTSVAAESSSSTSAIMRKSFSMGNLCNYGSHEGGASPPLASPVEQTELGEAVEGYASDDLVHTSSNARERKKGIPWTEEEHRSFLIGLQKLGKGDWRGISRNFVKSRTPTQVASHAQKYFLRRNNLTKRRRRSSLFDITPDTVSSYLEEEAAVEETGADEDDACAELRLGQSIPHGNSRVLDFALFSQQHQHAYPSVGGGGYAAARGMRQPSPLTSATMTIPEMMNESDEAIQGNNDIEVDEPEEMIGLKDGHVRKGVDVMDMVPEVNEDAEKVNRLPPHFPLIPVWPPQGLYGAPYPDLWAGGANIVKPTPVFPRPPAESANETAKIEELSITTARSVMEPTPLSYELLEEGSRQSAFHTMSQVSNNKEIDGKGNLISAISVL